jgi:hypothetical protein
MGQQPHPMVCPRPEDDRGWSDNSTSPKDVRGQPELPPDRLGFREERLGSFISHHLSASAEYTIVNVGGFDMDVTVDARRLPARKSRCPKVCSPPKPYQSVGGVIVLGGRESRLHGEGRQGIDDVLVN